MASWILHLSSESGWRGGERQVWLLARESDPDDTAVRHAIEGNFCRCTGYHNIVQAIQAAAAEGRGETTAAAVDTSAPQG